MMEVAATQEFSGNSLLRKSLARFSSKVRFLGTGEMAHPVKVFYWQFY